MDFQANDEDEEWQELFFEGTDLDAPAASDGPPAPAPPIDLAPIASPPLPATKGKAKAPAASIIEVSGPEPEEIVTAALPLPRPPATESAAIAGEDQAAPPAPASAPVAGPGRWGTAALALASLAALLSAVGGIVTARNLAELSATQAELAHREAALADAPAMLHAVERLGRLHARILTAAAAARPADAATKTDVRNQLDGLRRVFSTAQAPGTVALAGVVRGGQVELAGQIEALHNRIDMIERANTARRH